MYYMINLLISDRKINCFYSIYKTSKLIDIFFKLIIAILSFDALFMVIFVENWENILLL